VMKMGRKELREESALVRSSTGVVAPSSSFDIVLTHSIVYSRVQAHLRLHRACFDAFFLERPS
jgi:hypothetical protein